jgi:hypothetical protein
MSYRPLKSLSGGKLQEFTLVDEDSIAYQAGLHLAGMDSADTSALSRFNQGSELVGTFSNTFFDETSNDDPLVISTEFQVVTTSNVNNGIHTHTSSGGGLPETVYIGDTLELNIILNATEANGGGFETIGMNATTAGSATFSETINGTPAPTDIAGDGSITWQDFVDPTLSGEYRGIYRYTLTSVGSINISVQTNSVDQNNNTNAADLSVTLPTIEVQETRPPTSVSTETDLFQSPSEDLPTSSLKRNPVYWQTQPQGVKEMSDSELDILCTKFARKIVNNELPGTFRLSDGSPGVGYFKFIENMFTDTRGDGTNNYYHIWMKGSSTPIPPKRQPISIFRQNGVFAGLKALSEPEIQYTFGERVKKLIMSTGIGTYQLRSSSQGTPTALGTWVPRGTALDTRRTYFDDPGYTGAAPFDQDYTGSYIPDYETTFVGNYEQNYQSEFVGNYVGSFISLYTGDYAEGYTGSYETNFAKNYSGTFDATYVDNIYSGNFTLGYTGDYTGADVTEQFSNVYSGLAATETYSSIYVEEEYTGNYASDYETSYEGAFSSTFIANYADTNYVSEYENVFTGDYQDIFTALFVGTYESLAYEAAYSESFITNYLSDFIRDYTGDYTGDYERTTAVDFTGEYAGDTQETYTGDYTGTIVELYTGEYVRDISETYTGEYGRIQEELYTGDYEGDITETYTGDYTRQTPVIYTGDYERADPDVYTGNYNSAIEEQYTGDYERTQEDSYTGLYSGDISENYTGDYEREDEEIYEGQYIREVA